MIRNIIFLLVFYTGLIFLLILLIPGLILPKKIVTTGGKILGYWTAFCLRFVMATKIEVKGAELKDGLLKVSLEKIVPDHKKARTINIK